MDALLSFFVGLFLLKHLFFFSFFFSLRLSIRPLLFLGQVTLDVGDRISPIFTTVIWNQIPKQQKQQQLEQQKTKKFININKKKKT